MDRKKEYLLIRNVDSENKKKASFVLSCRGKDLSKAVREMIDNLAKEFDNNKGEITNENQRQEII